MRLALEIPVSDTLLLGDRFLKWWTDLVSNDVLFFFFFFPPMPFLLSFLF